MSAPVGWRDPVERGIWLAGLTALACMLGITGWRVAAERTEAIAHHQERRHAMAAIADAQISASLGIVDRMLHEVSADRLRLGADQAALGESLRSRHRIAGNLRCISVVDADGIGRASVLPEVVGADMANHRYFRYHRDGGDGLYFSPPFASMANRQILSISRAIRDGEGRFIGVAVATVEQEYLIDILRGTLTASTDAINIHHREDFLIRLRVPDPDKHIGKSVQGGLAFQEHMRSGQRVTDTLAVSAADGVERFQTVRRLGFPDSLNVTVSTAAGRVLNDWRHHALIESLLTAAAAALVVTVAAVASRSRRKLLLAEERYRRLFDEMLTGFALHEIVVDADGTPVDYRFVAVNPAFERLTGLKAAEAVGRTVREVLPQTEPIWIERYGKVALSGEPDEFHSHAPETGRHFEIRAFSPAPRQFAVALSDVTEQVRAVAAIRASEEKFALAFRRAPLLMSLSRIEDGCYEDVNDMFCKVSGFARDEAIGRTSVEIGWLTAAARETLVAALRRDGRIEGMELALRAKDGHEVTVSYSGEIVEIDGKKRLLSIAEDITEKKRVERELEAHTQHLEELVAQRTAEFAQAKEQAETANRAKSAFLANMSHELRTPLNAILGFSQLMAQDGDLDADQRRNLEIIERSGQHLLAMINDILDISRIDAGRLGVRSEAFDLGEFLGSMIDMVGPRARGKNLQLLLTIAPGSPDHVRADRSKLRHILLNLLNNAVKYTEAGSVALDARIDQEHECTMLQIEVSDTGIGIDTDDLPHIFEAFYQTRHGVQRGEGTGLGLAISRQFAELLGGRLSATSIPGRGSTFYVRVPVEIAAAPAIGEPGRELASVDTNGDTRILVVDDDPDHRLLSSRLLRRSGFDVREASSGIEAIEVFTAWHPHLILMDMRMPGGIDGMEAARRIRQLSDGQDVKIFALTASAYEEERGPIYAAGCNEVAIKPLEKDRLLEMMARHLKLSRQSAATPAAAPELPALSDLAPLRGDQIARLHAAAIQLDGDAVRAVADEVEGAAPVLAGQLRQIVDSYRFGLLAAAIDSTKGIPTPL